MQVSPTRDDSGNESENEEDGESSVRETEDMFANSASEDDGPAPKKSRRSD